MRETKTIQVYPSDDIINKKIREYESFGWEVVSNQRCQEYEGQTHGFDGSTTKHYSTFNKITFSREKSSSWYDAVTPIEREWESTNDSISALLRQKPVKKPYGLGALVLIFLPIPLVGISILAAVRKSKYKKAMKKYQAEVVPQIDELEAKSNELVAKAAKVVAA